tara:strand:- start:136 stop:1242 length:1107 start_codon:yes stop_codon:yes gene_type:complete
MKIGIPREIKIKENRVSCTPAAVHALVQAGHQVIIESSAGVGSGFSDEQYKQVGGQICDARETAWDVEMVIKVKEPIPEEYQFFKPGLLLFTYLHLASDKRLADSLCENEVSGIAYETVQKGNRLPLLEPMSEIAGRMSSLMGAYYLAKSQEGQGVLLGGVPGVSTGNVLILGGGVAGMNAARIAAGIGANVTLLEVDIEKMHYIDSSLNGTVRTIYSTEKALLDRLPEVDLLVGAVLLPGARAPRLIKREHLRLMKPGAVFVDIAIDQGGCAETSRPTTHDDPVYFEENVLHYCVANMPGAYARTATEALNNATLPYSLLLANHGLRKALHDVPELRSGLNTYQGKIVHKIVADAVGYPPTPYPFTD